MAEYYDTKEEIRKRIGLAIRKYRLLNQIELDLLAKSLKMDKEHLQAVEYGVRLMSIEKVVQAFKLLNIPYDLLFEEENHENPGDANQFVKDYRQLNAISLQILQGFVHNLAIFQNYKDHEESLKHIKLVADHEYAMLSRQSKLVSQIVDFDENIHSDIKDSQRQTVEMDVRQSFLETDIQELNISIRVRNVLYNSKYVKYTKVKDLLEATPFDLMRIPGMGKSSLQEIVDFLGIHGFSLRH